MGDRSGSFPGCTRVGLVYDPRELSGVTTARTEVAGVLQSRSSALLVSGCPLTDQQRTHSLMLLTHAGDWEVRLFPGKPDGILDCPVFLCRSLRGQNPE
jgi:hypothetical protein